MELRDRHVRQDFARDAEPVGVVTHPFLAARHPMQVAIEVDVPHPVEAGLGEGGIERLAMTLLGLRERAVDVEQERFDHGELN